MQMKMKKSLGIVMVVVITMLVVSSQFYFVHGRVLRPEVLKIPVGDGCEDFKGEESSINGMATFAVASNNNNFSTRQFARNLAHRLASGPSKKGPGH
ncbi:hypothetical protein Fmac_032364 [Flemingia macrophylla]|uniref:Uncharacterized protein n=1 Tax=Flemingia macrophylla TaxID=520843 RepID=A0ABD1L558_9FABA